MKNRKIFAQNQGQGNLEILAYEEQDIIYSHSNYEDLTALSLTSKFFSSDDNVAKYRYMYYLGTQYGEKVSNPSSSKSIHYSDQLKDSHTKSKIAAISLFNSLFRSIPDEEEYEDALELAASHLRLAKLYTGCLIPVLRELMYYGKNTPIARANNSTENFTIHSTINGLFNPSILTLCVMTGEIPAARFLLSKGADINAKNYFGEPLLFEFISSKPKQIKWLDEKLDKTEQEKNYLHMAECLLNFKPVVSLWVDKTNSLDDSLFNLLCERNVGKVILEKYFSLCSPDDIEKAKKSEILLENKQQSNLNETERHALTFLENLHSNLYKNSK